MCEWKPKWMVLGLRAVTCAMFRPRDAAMVVVEQVVLAIATLAVAQLATTA
jgi:hypothetical protein